MGRCHLHGRLVFLCADHAWRAASVCGRGSNPARLSRRKASSRMLRLPRSGMESFDRAATATNTSLRVAYVGSFGYHGFLSIDPNSIPAQICASATCTSGGTSGTRKGTVPQGTQYIPVHPVRILSFRRILLVHRGNSSYNALQTDVTHRLSKDCNSAATTPGRRIWTSIPG